ncbi:uroporphyrinogen-III synthase [Hydrogenophaga sp. BPS33]|uniref:uroporphyrinogen-III synthase n=1 Tax=Hydrogenophaga sp. BPS33 TaxID=2651974 RepID=UPI00131F9EDF|nr:uroporphyrinogen-III synthase [Hydrogenophaga sp. BPS33]QHE84912.1 uroporphyrinogen-III synthase [Hydrogenophaga sp. BPS33]
MTPLTQLVVTRPEPEAQAWVQALRAEGWPACARPLIEIAAPQSAEDLATLQHWRRHWMQADAMLFVSSAAVQHFFAHGVAPALASTRTRFWAPGPGTARRLAQALALLDMPESRIDAPAAHAAQYDSEHLWPLVSSQVVPGSLVLIVRGTSSHGAPPDAITHDPAPVAGRGRQWLIEQCVAAGATVRGCVAYARGAPPFSAEDQAWIQAATGEGHVWLFSSSEALHALEALRPPLEWSKAGALATHPRIAAAAQRVGFGRVVQTRPTVADVVRALESGWTRP